MANLNTVPNAYGYADRFNGWSGWLTSGVSSAEPDFINNTAIYYRLDLPTAVTVSSCTLSLEAFPPGFSEEGTVYESADLVCVLYKGDSPFNSENQITRQQISVKVQSSSTTPIRFSFSGISAADVSQLSFYIYRAGGETRVGLTRPTAAASFNLPELGMSIEPSTVYESGGVTLRFYNRLGANVAVELWQGSTRLNSVTASGDTLNVSTLSSWIPDGSTSVSVSVRASDDRGRTASGSFQLAKYQASAATPQAPKSTTVSGTSAITFSWTVDESHGAQTKAEIQTSYDGATWFAADVVNGSAKTYEYAANTFRAGTVYWRVRVTNSAGLVSPWSASVSFTVSWPALSVSTSPATVYQGNNVTLTFGNRLSRALTVRLTYENTVLANYSASADSLTLQAPSSWFTKAGVTGNTMRVDVSVSDDRNRTATGRFTLSKFVPSAATPQAPKSTTVSGDSAIPFSWTVDESAAAQTKAELQYSTDNVNWSALATVTGSAKTWSSAAYRFKQGTVYWRLRVTNAFGVTGEWSASVSFTVNYPALSVSASPATVYQGNNVTLTFDNRLSRTLKVQLKNENKVLATYNPSKDTALIQTQASWFSAAGVTGDTMRVDVTVSDDLGRTATGRFTLSKFVPSAATPQAPKSTTVSGDSAIPFSWTVDESAAAQTKAELQYSTDNVNWSALATVTGSAKTWSSAAYRFKQGTVYWRLRVTNAFGVTGEWSASVSFTVNYPALSITAAPATVNMGNSVRFEVTNRLSRALNVTYKAGSTVLRTTTLSASAWSFTFPVQWFADAGATGSSMQVDVQIADDLGRTATVRVTMAKTPMTLSLSAASVYTGGKITATLGNTAGRPYDLVFKYGTIVLHSITGSGDGGRTVTCPDSWFSAASVTGSTMLVDVTVTDDLNRTAAANFRLVRPQGSTFTPTAPKSTTADGAGEINFAWTVSDDWGTQTKAELQWSTDNAVWKSLATISGSGKTWTAPAVKFPAGTIYWRGRVTNSFGVLGSWSNSASFTVAYSATSQVVPVNSPTSGIISGSIPEPFSVKLQASGPVHDPFTVASAVFYWRAGGSGDYTAVDMTPNGSTASVTIPAGTFPSGAIEWYASATDNTGAATETAVFSLTVRNAVVEAVPVSPISTVESGSGPIVFRWSYGSLDGSAQSAAELQWSADGEAWNDLASVTGAATVWTAPADTFEAGTVYWRVRAANAAGTFGPWSSAVSFVSFAAPHVSGVRGTGVPYTTVTWQTAGQLAYEVEIDGKSYGPYFGEDVRSFTVPEALADGTHVVRVRAQNRYGLWSTWAAAEISVQNVPDGGIRLNGQFNDVAELSWEIIPPPAITKQPVSVVSDSYVGFTVEAVGENLSYRWQSGSGSAFGNIEGLTGGTGPAFATRPAATLAGKSFRCIVSSPDGTTISQPATWTRAQPQQAPEVIFAKWNPTEDVLYFIATAWSSMTVYYRKPGATTWTQYLTNAPKVTNAWKLFKAREYYAVFTNAAGTTESSIVSVPAEKPAPDPDIPQDPVADTTPSYIYRDGKKIGKSSSGHFVDRTAVGPHAYYVLKETDDGNYSKSNVVIGTTAVDCPAIALLSGGDFLTLRLSEMAQRAQSFRRQRQVAYIQYAGATFPEAEIGEHEQFSVSFDAAWLHDDAEEAKTFEAMLGKPVILKTPGGELIVGVLDGYERRDPRFYRAYSCTLQQMHWRDYVES